jgi:hypothetical protein
MTPASATVSQMTEIPTKLPTAAISSSTDRDMRALTIIGWWFRSCPGYPVGNEHSESPSALGE